MSTNNNCDDNLGAINITEEFHNLQTCLQTSLCRTTWSSEEDLSFCLSLDQEVETYANRINDDELPAFPIRLISPFGRSPSPISSEFLTNTTARVPSAAIVSHSPCHNNSDYVAVQDINAQISPPNEFDQVPTSSNLETIFEGVFLQTPPRQHPKLNYQRRSKSLLEKVAVNSTKADKENRSPQTKYENRRNSLFSNHTTDFS